MTVPYKNLIDISKKFLTVIEEETRLLESHQMNQALGLLSQKEDLANQHAQSIDVYSRGEEWKNCTLEELNTLKDILDDLSDILIRNQKALSLVHSVQENIMGKITRAIRDQDAPVYRYSKDRRQGINLSPVSLSAFNEQI